MKKKSLVAMGLAGVMTIGMCVPVLASDIADNEFIQTDNTGKETEVIATNPVVYSVKIPSKLNIENTDGVIDVTLGEGAVLGANKDINIAISGSAYNSESKTLTLTSAEGGDTVTATVESPGSNSLKNDAANKKVTYTIKKPTYTNAGKYTANLTFTVSYNGSEGL